MTVGGNRSYGLAGEEPCWTGAAVGEKLISSGVGLFFPGRSDITKESSFRNKIMERCFFWTRWWSFKLREHPGPK